MTQPIHGGIILCGGKSTRMGRPKWSLPFGPEIMLARVARIMGEVVSPIVIVAAAGQDIPLLSGTEIVRDRREDSGPLEGIAAGLTALAGRCEAAYISSCDAPLLQPQFIRRVLELLEGHDAAVPVVERFEQPLSAAYRCECLIAAEKLIAAGRMRPVFLFEEVRTRFITPEELREVDPDLASLRNANRPEDYEAALREAGFG